VCVFVTQVETSDDDEEDDDEDDDVTSPFGPHSHLPRGPLLNNNNNNNDDMDIGPIDPDTQAKLAAILEATGKSLCSFFNLSILCFVYSSGITNAPIPEDFWRDQQVVRLLTSSVTSNLNGLSEIANAIVPSSSSNNISTNTSTMTSASSIQTTHHHHHHHHEKKTTHKSTTNKDT
jgi:hypothetical protein